MGQAGADHHTGWFLKSRFNPHSLGVTSGSPLLGLANKEGERLSGGQLEPFWLSPCPGLAKVWVFRVTWHQVPSVGRDLPPCFAPQGVPYHSPLIAQPLPYGRTLGFHSSPVPVLNGVDFSRKIVLSGCKRKRKRGGGRRGGARKEIARLSSQFLSSNSLTNESKLQWQIRATCGSV